MLTYEEVAGQLAFAAAASGLELWDIRHMIDTATCDKEFSCFASPQSSLNRHGRAAMRFVWDVGYTVEAVYGGNCSLYHDDDEDCTHHHLEPKPMIDLEIRFDLGRPPAGEVAGFAQRVRECLSEVIRHGNLPEIRVELAIHPDERVSVHEAYAEYVWTMEFGSEPLDFRDIMEEVRDILVALQEEKLLDLDGGPDRPGGPDA